jgi:glycerol-3-phosphate cytidylyltransferase-like family protein
MKLAQLFEAQEKVAPKKLLAVILGGRFQPFHKGHFAAYKQLGKWFGQDNVWIASSDKTTDPDEKESVSFLDFTERKELMVTLYHINPDHIVQCKNPAFSPVEVLSMYKAPVVCVMAVGAKDVSRYKDSKMFEPYPMSKGKPVPFDTVMDELSTANEKTTIYYVVMPNTESGLSGTACRKILASVKSEGSPDAHKAMLKCFGSYDKDIARMVISNLKGHDVLGVDADKDKDKKETAKDKA